VEISESIILKERKLNIAPAIKKQPFNRTYEAASPPAVHSYSLLPEWCAVHFPQWNGIFSGHTSTAYHWQYSYNSR